MIENLKKNRLLLLFSDFCTATGILILLTGMLAVEDHITFFYIGLLNCSIALLIDFFVGHKIGQRLRLLSVFAIIFVCYSISAFTHFQNVEATRIIINDRLVWLVIPICILLCRVVSIKLEYLILLIFVGCVTIIFSVGLYNFYYLLTIYNAPIDYATSYINGAYIPFGIHHHTLSIVMVACVVILSLLLSEKHTTIAKVLIAFILAYFFVGIHLLGSRVGILALYFFVLLFIYKFIRTHRLKPSTYIFAFSAFVFLIIVLMLVFPTFYTRLLETKSEISYLFSTDEINWVGNISSRLVSFKRCLPLISQYFWLGCGEQDYKSIIMQHYDKIKVFNDLERIYPPNQWYTHTIMFGFPITIVFFICWITLLIMNKNYTNIYFFGIWIALFLLLLTENPLNHNMSQKMYAVLLPLAFRLKRLKSS